jgi:Na+/proline symporter
MKNLKRTGLIALLTAVSSLVLAAPALAQTETTSSDAAGATVGIIMMICWLLVMVVFLAIYIWVAVWIYKDASKRDTSAALWVILWIFFSWVGLIVYLIVRPKEMSGGTTSGTPPPPPPPAATETPPPPPSEPGAIE